MPKNNNSNIIIGVITVLILAGGLTGGFWFMNTARDLSAKLDQKQVEFNLIKQKVSTLPELQQNSLSLAVEADKLMKFVPSREGQAEFIMELQHLAGNSGTQILNCTVKDTVRAYKTLKNYQIFQWDVEVLGNYKTISKFLELLLNGNRLLMISEMKLTATPVEDTKKNNRDAYKLSAKLVLDLITRNITSDNPNNNSTSKTQGKVIP